jgi:hypothetical protein
MIAPLFDDAGNLELFVGSQIEVLLGRGKHHSRRQQQAAQIVDRLRRVNVKYYSKWRAVSEQNKSLTACRLAKNSDAP